ncbi:MAG: phosphoenolpyruvate carboxykinase (GTP), partial [Candidatus Aminicenantes bacterium]|nr:phosphoenolpyruvate carboxykinase (GTP) [Candidatus Aminicenantes bacterium]
RLIPLVTESFNWPHGVFMGARTGSETTAAAAGKVGVLRRDPFAMLPFCGYNMGDYFRHWINIGSLCSRPPRIYGVNWFRVDERGKFIWPGFGDNARVLKWILDRIDGKVGAKETPLGLVPHVKDLVLDGLTIPKDKIETLFAIKPGEWNEELADIKAFLDPFSRHLPYEIGREYDRMARALKS